MNFHWVELANSNQLVDKDLRTTSCQAPMTFDLTRQPKNNHDVSPQGDRAQGLQQDVCSERRHCVRTHVTAPSDRVGQHDHPHGVPEPDSGADAQPVPDHLLSGVEGPPGCLHDHSQAPPENTTTVELPESVVEHLLLFMLNRQHLMNIIHILFLFQSDHLLTSAVFEYKDGGRIWPKCQQKRCDVPLPAVKGRRVMLS